jgi:hypothetical protein
MQAVESISKKSSSEQVIEKKQSVVSATSALPRQSSQQSSVAPTSNPISATTSVHSEDKTASKTSLAEFEMEPVRQKKSCCTIL